jgi:hypothetical protein
MSIEDELRKIKEKVGKAKSDLDDLKIETSDIDVSDRGPKIFSVFGDNGGPSINMGSISTDLDDLMKNLGPSINKAVNEAMKGLGKSFFGINDAMSGVNDAINEAMSSVEDKMLNVEDIIQETMSKVEEAIENNPHLKDDFKFKVKFHKDKDSGKVTDVKVDFEEKENESEKTTEYEVDTDTEENKDESE